MSTMVQDSPAGVVHAQVLGTAAQSEGARSMQLVSFKLGEETYGIEITKIREIILVGRSRRFPRRRPMSKA